MIIYYDTNSNPEQLSVSLDETFCINHGWSYATFDAPSFDPSSNVLKILEGAPVVEVFVPSHAPISELLAEVSLIQQRKQDGVQAYQETLAELRLLRISSGIPHAVFSANVYFPMSNVINSLNNGGWLDAYDALPSVPTNEYLTPVMKTGFSIKLAKYIVYSGKYPDFTGGSVDANGIITEP